MMIAECFVCHGKYILHTAGDGEDVITADGYGYLCCKCTAIVRQVIVFEVDKND